MRLLLTTDTVGGVWTFSRELTRELLQLGHAVALVSFGRLPSDEQTEWCAAMQSAHPDNFRYDASPAPLEWMEQNHAAYTAGESLLLRVAMEFAPDLLHSNQFCFGRVPLLLPRIITAHSDVLSWAAVCRPGGLEPSPWLSTYRALTQDGLSAADAVVAPTCWMLTALLHNFEVPGSRHVVLNGRTLTGAPDSELSSAAAQRTSAASLRVPQAVSTGRFWDPAKNLSLLTGLHSPFPILIAGEEKLEGSSTELPVQHKTPGPLQALGFLDEPHLLSLFRSSSLYIAAAVYEPFGLAPLEAALCGCAVLAHDIPSLREVWGDAALYFSSRATLEELLQTLHASPALLGDAQQRSLRRAQELTARRMTASYIALYQDLLREQTSRQLPRPVLRTGTSLQPVPAYAAVRQSLRAPEVSQDRVSHGG